MATRLFGPVTLLVETPFDGQGVSLYANTGTEVVYRRPALFGLPLLGADEGSRLRSAEDVDVPLPKTTRVAFVAAPAETLDYEFPPEWAEQQVSINIRTFRDGIENEDIAAETFVLDADSELASQLSGTATLLSVELRDAGVVRIRWSWVNTGDIEPESFTLIRTAGPTTPADAEFAATGDGVYEFDTDELSDAGAYTFKIQAAGGVVTADILTGITFTPDATGPDAPTGTAEAW